MPSLIMRKSRSKHHIVTFALVFVALTIATSLHQLYTYFKSLEADLARMQKLLNIAEDNSLKSNHNIRKRSPGVSADTDGQVSTLNTQAVGTTYIRWGRTKCPNKVGTRLVYEGYAGGSYYSHVGGGSDFMCLHSNVTYTPGHYIDGLQATAFVYGVEYRDSSASYSLFDLSLLEHGQLQYQAVPCAVCLTQSTTQLMIPSRETCPDGWRVEYTGYIMTGGYANTKHSSNHICVDDIPEAIPGTEGNQHGAYLYAAEIDCGFNTPCLPYVNGREIRCVVCSYGNIE